MQNKCKIAVFVSGGGTNLQAIVDAQKSGIINSGNVQLVISNKENAFALERAKKAGIKTYTVIKNNYGSQEAYEDELIRILEDNQIDLIVLAGFMLILGPKLISKYPQRIINVHPALIPSFCGEGFYGLKVHEAALEYGVKVTGATVHFVNEIPDGGRIIMQKAVEVKEDDTPEVLQKRVMEEAEWIILPESIEKICREINLLQRGYR